ncbi:Pantothenate kinase [Streptomyces misionensis JCM 4497]
MTDPTSRAVQTPLTMECDLTGPLDAPERPPAQAGGDSLRRPHPSRVERAARQDAAAAHRRGGGETARSGRCDRPGRGARHLPPAVPAAEPLRRSHRRPQRRAEHLPRRAGLAVRHPVRHRRGRFRRRRQVHRRPSPPGPAVPLARAPPRGAGHHRRLPAAHPGTGGPRPDVPQGLPRVVRPPGADPLRRRHQGRQERGDRAGLLAPDLRHRPRPEAHRPPPRHPDRGGPQRPPARAARQGRPHPGGPRRLLRLQRVRRRERRGHRALVPQPLQEAAPDRVPGPPLVLPQVHPGLRGGGPRLRAHPVAHDQQAQPGREHRPHPRPRHPDRPQGSGPQGPAAAPAQAVGRDRAGGGAVRAP